MAKDETIVRFEEVSHEFGPNKPILVEANFNIRRGMKMTLMGQNGAGKSTIFKMITGEVEPEDGQVIKSPKLTIATSRQVIARDQVVLTVREFFQSMFDHKVYDIDPRIDEVL
jgi:ATPase subunit of ABC transporter with duplicated ATPase domains